MWKWESETLFGPPTMMFSKPKVVRKINLSITGWLLCCGMHDYSRTRPGQCFEGRWSFYKIMRNPSSAWKVLRSTSNATSIPEPEQGSKGQERTTANTNMERSEGKPFLWWFMIMMKPEVAIGDILDRSPAPHVIRMCSINLFNPKKSWWP